MRTGDDRERHSAHERARRARQRRRRRAIRRRRAALLALVAAALVAISLAAFGGGSPQPASSTPPRTVATRPPAKASSTRRSAARRTSVTRTRTTQHTHAAGPSPGSLPQTTALPSAQTATFRTLMADLFAGVVHDSVTRALPAFFPEQAYLQLKSITDAAGDWRDRLVHDYGLDLGAAHRLLGSGARGARLVGVTVVPSYGHWINPGVCDNSIGYYEMPNARVVYRQDGRLRSFGIASMISWRGVWYVVHLGAILRASDVGMVNDPAAGAGVSAYSGTC